MGLNAKIRRQTKELAVTKKTINKYRDIARYHPDVTFKVRGHNGPLTAKDAIGIMEDHCVNVTTDIGKLKDRRNANR